jgi:hypothetical protein
MICLITSEYRSSSPTSQHSMSDTILQLCLCILHCAQASRTRLEGSFLSPIPLPPPLWHSAACEALGVKIRTSTYWQMAGNVTSSRILLCSLGLALGLRPLLSSPARAILTYYTECLRSAAFLCCLLFSCFLIGSSLVFVGGLLMVLWPGDLDLHLFVN